MDDTGLVPVGVVATRPLVAEMLPDAAFPPADLPQPEATSANTATTAAAVHMPRLPAICPPAHALRPPPRAGHCWYVSWPRTQVAATAALLISWSPMRLRSASTIAKSASMPRRIEPATASRPLALALPDVEAARIDPRP